MIVVNLNVILISN